MTVPSRRRDATVAIGVILGFLVIVAGLVGTLGVRLGQIGCTVYAGDPAYVDRHDCDGQTKLRHSL